MGTTADRAARFARRTRWVWPGAFLLLIGLMIRDAWRSRSWWAAIGSGQHGVQIDTTLTGEIVLGSPMMASDEPDPEIRGAERAHMAAAAVLFTASRRRLINNEQFLVLYQRVLVAVDSVADSIRTARAYLGQGESTQGAPVAPEPRSRESTTTTLVHPEMRIGRDSPPDGVVPMSPVQLKPPDAFDPWKMLGTLIAGGVLFFHYRRDRRETRAEEAKSTPSARHGSPDEPS